MILDLTQTQSALPYAFTGPYAGGLEFPETAMDKRHIFMLHEILCAWPFKSALEIGSFKGASATAFIEAINRGVGLGESGGALFCDVSVSDSLIEVVTSCRYPDRVRITPQPSWAVLDSAEDYDFVFVDAAHDLDSVSVEIKKLLRRRPLCVMAHDTNATAAGYSKCEGAQLLRETFMKQAGYRCIEDCVKRSGERTDRGLFLATHGDLFDLATAAFAKYQEMEIR
jgi:hypothetical protein